MLYEDEDETGTNPAEPSSVPPSESPAGIGQNSEAAISPPPVFHPLAYRGVVANWPVEWRERWGRRANSLGRKWALLARCGNSGVCRSLESAPTSCFRTAQSSRSPNRPSNGIDRGRCDSSFYSQSILHGQHVSARSCSSLASSPRVFIGPSSAGTLFERCEEVLLEGRGLRSRYSSEPRRLDLRDENIAAGPHVLQDERRAPAFHSIELHDDQPAVGFERLSKRTEVSLAAAPSGDRRRSRTPGRLSLWGDCSSPDFPARSRSVLSHASSHRPRCVRGIPVKCRLRKPCPSRRPFPQSAG